jgi:hypothetical protein
MDDPSQGTRTWVDRIATLFDRAWHAGKRPRIEDYLSGVAGPRRSQLLEELLRVELDYRRKLGETPTEEEYGQRFPEHDSLIRKMLAELVATSPPSVDEQRAQNGGEATSLQGHTTTVTKTDHPRRGSADDDATLTYSAARADGLVEPLLSPQDLDGLASVFVSSLVLQDRYVLERELGRGGIGLVFLGRDRRLERPVAIKLILPSGAGGLLVPGVMLPARGTPTSVLVVVVLVAWVVGGGACLIAWRAWAAAEGYRRASPPGAAEPGRFLAGLISLGSLQWFLVIAQSPPFCGCCLLPNPGYLLALHRSLTTDKLQGSWQVVATMKDGELSPERNGAILTFDRGNYHEVDPDNDTKGICIFYNRTTTEWESPYQADSEVSKVLLVRESVS